MRSPSPRHRGGAVAVEAAVVLPLVFLIVLGIIVGGMNVFRHQQMACLAREGARYASVRGADFERTTDFAAPTRQQIVDAAIVPRAVGLDPAGLTVAVEWIDRGTNTAHAWDAAPKAVHSVAPTGEYVSNAVRVTVSYTISAGLFGEPVTVGSVCEMPMTH